MIERDPLVRGVPDLMRFQVREVLLVSTLYDSFILEEDARFSDKLFSEYMEFNLSSPPRITRASTGARAMHLLKRRTFDLVITMARVPDVSPDELAKRIKGKFPELPVVLLAYNASFSVAGESRWEVFDRVFVWTGHNRTLLALIKSVEDLRNVGHDTRRGLVRAIMVIEDSPLYYSSYLPLIYTEIFEQTRNLLADGVNDLDRIWRVRARPKVLLASSYEEASRLHRKYRDHILGIISDVRLPRRGVQDGQAGIAFLKRVRKSDRELPILVQSSELKNREEALALGAGFVDKNSPDLLQETRDFLRRNFGFGDFVFRMLSGDEIARAGTTERMRDLLQTVPDESLVYHAQRQHLSNWLLARGAFSIALELRDRSVSDFPSLTDLRAYLCERFNAFLGARQRGKITDFSRGADHLERDFVRLGGGSLGGKGRGVAFIYTMLNRLDIRARHPDVSIVVPRTTAICTDEFDRFVEENFLRERAGRAKDDRELEDMFLKSRISQDVHRDLEAMLTKVRYPLAVRSSSLLEDSQFQPFAGVYSTFILPNNAPDLRTRLRQLRRAIKLVYASTFNASSRSYMRAIHRRTEEEKMGVLIQRLVGTPHGDSFYPTFSGVAQSYNYYPVRNMAPEEGIATVALGLGQTVVEGGRALRFSPARPRVLPQMGTPDEALRCSQSAFYALDLSGSEARVTADEHATLIHHPLSVAEEHGTLRHVGATHVPDEGRIYDTIERDGVRIVNFAPILKYDRFPLTRVVKDILALGEESMGCPVEMEFAVNMDVPDGELPEFAILQIRPLVTTESVPFPVQSPQEGDAVVIRSTRALGNGRLGGIRDIVLVRLEGFDRTQTQPIAEEVARVNGELVREHRPYLLMGPGRWGTSDRFLGIPVRWTDVSAARVIVEVALDGYEVDPSQGTHFFHNITSLRIGYITVDGRREDEAVDWKWLQSVGTRRDYGQLTHIALDEPLEVLLDGRQGSGMVRLSGEEG